MHDAPHAEEMTPPTPRYPHVAFEKFEPGESAESASGRFLDVMRQRRSVRFFSDRAVSEEVIRNIVSAAGTAPSGANKQPWRFVAVSNPALKREIRIAAEAEEREFYERRATAEWLADLAPLGTDSSKPFLEIAPWVIVAFKLMKTDPDPASDPPGKQGKVYYVEESVGIAAGLLIAAIHHAGLVTLTHTPSPMGFLSKVLRRPEHERAFLVLPVGYPAEGATVPDIRRKALDEILVLEK
jgi:iodotyrosine deiodinase